MEAQSLDIATVAPAPAPTPAVTSFTHLPISLFGSVMGLTGLSVAWRLAHETYGLPVEISIAIAGIAVAAFVAVVAGYLLKCFTAAQNVRAEFQHPIIGHLFATFLISILLLPIVIAPVALLLARVIWVIGALGMTAFAWLVVDRWMTHQQQYEHASPPWVVPVVGMLDLPLAMPALGFGSMRGAMELGLAVGLFFAIPLFTLIFSRLIFEAPLPDGLQPTLLILLAPFSVGVSTYVTTFGHVDFFAESLYALSLFVLAVLLGRLRYMLSCCPFRVSWWAISFPLATSAIASIRIAAADPNAVTNSLALTLLALASVVIALLLIRTLWGVAAGELKTLAG